MKKKTIKKINGWLLLVIIFLALFAGTAIETGILGAVIIWGSAGILASLLMLALKWIVGD